MPQTLDIPSEPIEGTGRGLRKRYPCKRFEDDGETHSNKKAKQLIAHSSIGSITSTTSSAAPPSSAPSTQTRVGNAQPHTSEDIGRDAKVVLSDSELIEVTDSDNDLVELIEDDDDELSA